MITLYVEEKIRSKTDILYGVTQQSNNIFSVDFINENDFKDVGKPNTFLLLDQTTILNHAAVIPAHSSNSTILLYNREPVTSLETLEFYELLELTSGAVMAIGQEASTSIRDFQERTNHISCPIEELDHVIYPGQYNSEEAGEYERLVVHTSDRLARFFRNYCLRLWKAEADLMVDSPYEYEVPFDFPTSEINANLFLSFEELTRERLRMIDNRYRNIYVPHSPVSTVFDPRSFFKANSTHLNGLISTMTEHQAAAMLKPLFESMYQYINDVFVGEPSVNTMKLPGSVDLFQAIAYNLSRDI